jgi:hypothetical protein
MMTPDQIAEFLEQSLASHNVVVQATEEQGYLIVTLNRSTDSPLNYPEITDRITALLKPLQLPSVHSVMLYSRALGEFEPDWQTQFDLVPTIPNPQTQPVVTVFEPELLHVNDLPASDDLPISDRIPTAELPPSDQSDQVLDEPPTAELTSPVRPDDLQEQTTAELPVAEAVTAAIELSATRPISEPTVTSAIDPSVTQPIPESDEGITTIHSVLSSPSAVNEGETTPIIPADAAEAFDISQYCFIRNTALLRGPMPTPDPKISQLIMFVHTLDESGKRQILPLLAEFFKSPERMRPETLPDDWRSWFSELQQLSERELKTTSIWLSRYCANPEETLPQIEKSLETHKPTEIKPETPQPTPSTVSASATSTSKRTTQSIAISSPSRSQSSSAPSAPSNQPESQAQPSHSASSPMGFLAHHFSKWMIGLAIGLVFVVVRCGIRQTLRNASREPDLQTQAAATLYQAAGKGSVAEARKFLDQGVDVNAVTVNQITPLHLAVSGCILPANVKSTSDIECFPLKPDHRVVAEMLIRKGAQVNSKDQFGATPLHWAAYYGTKETVEALLNNGAEINTPTKSGMTPLDIAQGEDNTEAIAVLKSRGGKASEPQP